LHLLHQTYGIDLAASCAYILVTSYKLQILDSQRISPVGGPGE